MPQTVEFTHFDSFEWLSVRSPNNQKQFINAFLAAKRAYNGPLSSASIRHLSICTSSTSFYARFLLQYLVPSKSIPPLFPSGFPKSPISRFMPVVVFHFTILLFPPSRTPFLGVCLLSYPSPCLDNGTQSTLS